MKENWGHCADDAVRAGITYPGQSDLTSGGPMGKGGWGSCGSSSFAYRLQGREDAAMATRNQGGWYNSMVWECYLAVLNGKNGLVSCG